MKKLQNNFTTPEQSKRLLELGVPSDSADAILRHYIWASGYDENDEENWETPMVIDYKSQLSVSDLLEMVIDDEYDKAIPCWSVGRLIEIHETCTSCLFERRYTELSVLEDVLAQIAEDVMATDECWDFSKLEEPEV